MTAPPFQRITLFGERYCISVIDCELALVDLVHKFDAGDHVSSAAERFDIEHPPAYPRDSTIDMLGSVVEGFDRMHYDENRTAGVDHVDGRVICTTHLHRDLTRSAICLYSRGEKIVSPWAYVRNMA
ncbi:hypothetical protein ACQ4WP_24290 [Janthinobacterium sp. GB4P2]|uniref:hypothetical protein n=1 Tax=Janthinobacterium sp. GB4P2 TaxID=3424189 RepID=UPI003F22AB06